MRTAKERELVVDERVEGSRRAGAEEEKFRGVKRMRVRRDTGGD